MKLLSRSGFFGRPGLIVLFLSLASALVALFPFGPDLKGSALGGATPSVSSPPRVGGHTTRMSDERPEITPRAFDFQTSGENVAANEAPIPPGAPTRTSFIANWNSVSGAIGYRLDVSTSSSFDSYVKGYRDFDAGGITSHVITGLRADTTYYYRIRAYSAAGTSADSGVTSAATTSGPGLIINATFDTSITRNPNAAAVEAMINQAVARFESLFSDPITVSILFRYSTTDPRGSPLGSGTLAESNFVIYTIPWNTYLNALQVDAKTGNDTTANGTLPSGTFSANLLPSSAGGRAVGLNTPTAMFSNGSVGTRGPYDGIVSINSAQTFQF